MPTLEGGNGPIEGGNGPISGTGRERRDAERVRFTNLKEKRQPDERANAIGIGGALNPPPQFERFFQSLLTSRQGSISGQAANARRVAGNALEARGLGQSSLVGRHFSEIDRNSQLAKQQAQNQVQGLRFGLFQSALDFERQKDLLRLGANVAQDRTPWWNGALQSLTDIAGTVYINNDQNKTERVYD